MKDTLTQIMRQDADTTDLLTQSHGLKRISLKYELLHKKTIDYKISVLAEANRLKSVSRF